MAQKGSISVLAIAGIALLLVGCLWYAYQQQSQSVQNGSSAGATSTQPAINPGATSSRASSWQTYESSLGFKFKYPSDYSLPVDLGEQVFTHSQHASFSFYRESADGSECLSYMCTMPTVSSFSLNQYSWDYLGAVNDGAETESAQPADQYSYRLEQGTCRYYVRFTDNKNALDVLSTFALTKTPNCN